MKDVMINFILGSVSLFLVYLFVSWALFVAYLIYIHFAKTEK